MSGAFTLLLDTRTRRSRKGKTKTTGSCGDSETVANFETDTSDNSLSSSGSFCDVSCESLAIENKERIFRLIDTGQLEDSYI